MTTTSSLQEGTSHNTAIVQEERGSAQLLHVTSVSLLDIPMFEGMRRHGGSFAEMCYAQCYQRIIVHDDRPAKTDVNSSSREPKQQHTNGMVRDITRAPRCLPIVSTGLLSFAPHSSLHLQRCLSPSNGTETDTDTSYAAVEQSGGGYLGQRVLVRSWAR